MKMQLRPFVIIVATALCVWAVSSQDSLAAPSGTHFIFQQVALAPLQQAHTFVVTGTARGGACVWPSRDMQLPVGAPAWEVRDLGVDPDRCVKLVEEGIPTQIPSADQTPSIRMVVQGLRAGRFPGLASVAAATVSSGYYRWWYTNAVNNELTGDWTYITWSWDGTCALNGSIQGQWDYDPGLGWGVASNGGTSNLSCARQYGETWSTMTGGGCYHYYDSVQIYGWWDGLLGKGGSTPTATCGPVWLHELLQRTAG